MEQELRRNIRAVLAWAVACIISTFYVLFSVLIQPHLFVEFLGGAGVIAFILMLLSFRKEVLIYDGRLCFHEKATWWFKKVKVPIDTIISVGNEDEYILINDASGKCWKLSIIFDDKPRQKEVYERFLGQSKLFCFDTSS